MAYFPFMIDIKDKDCLIVGGGKIAHRKAVDLLQFGARITVIAPEICQDILGIPGIVIQKKEYEKTDIYGRFLVVAATDSNQLNRGISKDCKAADILVNAVDIKDACTFIFPAIIKKDNLTVSISTGGSSPAAAAYLKEKIEDAIPNGYEKNIEILGCMRDLLAELVLDQDSRRKLYYDLLEEACNEKKLLDKEFIYKYIEESIRKDL